MFELEGGEAYNVVQTLGGTQTSWAHANDENINVPAVERVSVTCCDWPWAPIAPNCSPEMERNVAYVSAMVGDLE